MILDARSLLFLLYPPFEELEFCWSAFLWWCVVLFMVYCILNIYCLLVGVDPWLCSYCTIASCFIYLCFYLIIPIYFGLLISNFLCGFFSDRQIARQYLLTKSYTGSQTWLTSKENLRMISESPPNTQTWGNTSLHIHGWSHHRKVRKRPVQTTINMETRVNFRTAVISLIN